MVLRTAPLILILAACALNGQVDVLTAQYDLSRTSSNTQEQSLNQANVNAVQFGKLFSRSVDASFYASPLIATGLNIAGAGTKDVVFVATLGNTLYAFDADDPNVSNPYWSLNVGTPMYRGCCFLGPTIGILSTPVIDRSTNTIYFTAIVQNTDVGLYLYAADLSTGALKFNSPQRITYTFPATGITVSQANLPGPASWLQRSGLLLVNGVLYVGTSAVWQGSTIFSQEGFIQAFQANNLSVVMGTFETTPSGAGGAFWQAGRGLAADSSGNVFAVVDSDTYNPLVSFGNSVLRFSPGTVTVADWFTPSDWSFLYGGDLDQTSNGVTLIPGTTLAFTGGKIGVIYLLNQSSLGGLEPGSGNAPLQEFQASQGCGSQQCGQHLPTAYWPNAASPYLYVWDIYDFLRAYPFDSVSQRFETSNASAGTLLPSRTGGITVSSNGNTNGTGIVWAATAAEDPLTTAVPGTLRAYNANNIMQELYDSDQNSCRDSMGSFVKMSTPIVANGKVYVNTQSNVLPVYGLLSSLPAGYQPPGTVQVTVNTNIAGPTVTVDGNSPCTGSAEFNWTPGSQHTIAAASPQAGLPGTSPQAGTPGTQFVWTGWSDGGSISHTVTPTIATTYTATFSTQYLLTANILPVGGGSVVASPASATGYYASGAQVQLTAVPVSGCTFMNWTGALAGSANSQTVTMSAPQSVTANFQCSASAPVSFVTGYASKLLRNDFSGWAGMAFTVGSRALTVSALGRVTVYSDRGTHLVKLVNAGTGADVVGGSVSISMPAGNAGQFAWTSLAGPVTLQPNTAYYLVSQELSGGDLWYDFGPIATTGDASVPNAIFSSDSVSWLPMSSSDSSYVPVSFLYTLGAPAQYLLTTSVSPLAGGSIGASPTSTGGYYTSGTLVQLTATPASGCTFLYWTGALTGNTNPQSVTMSAAQSVTANFQCSGPAGTVFLTGYALNNPSLRHDFTGWVGMKLTVGANPLMVTALGRICVAGNVTAHAVKFVNAGDGSDVAGALVSVNTAGCIPNQFAYGAITPVTLPAGASYYLVSQETYGGDQWFDEGGVSATNDAAVKSGVYFYNGAWYSLGSANTSYVPPNFQYSVATPSPISVTVQVSPAGPSFAVDGNTSTAAQTLTWSSGTSHTISTSSPQNAGTGAQYAWGGWSDGGAISHTVAPTSGTTYTGSFATQFLLTTSVSPAGGGTVSAGGYYNSGTPVTLTATPAANCAFSNWSGGLTGSVSPTSITMSTPQTVTANFQCTTTPPSSTTFLTGYRLSGQPLRNDFTGWVGMKLTVGASTLTISSLGRICVANNSQSHTVKFVNASTGSDLAGAFASVNMAGCAVGQFVYSSISPVTLSAGTSYYLVTQETQGGDQWYDEGAVSAVTDATINSAVYSYNGVWYPIGSANTSYVPPNFQYSIGGAAPPQYVLTTSVSPAASGSVAASPSSAGGSYASGTVVQLTATSAANCTFSGWSGSLTGSANPASITMSGAQTVTANFQCSTPTSGCGPGVLPQALQQLTKTMTYLNTSQFPLATNPTNSNQWNAGSPAAWTSGFFPGLIWHMYEQTLNPSLLARAQAQTASLAGELTDASTHDVGFRIMSSYGNGYRITGDPSYMSAIQTAAATMATLYQEGAGVINSWPYYSSNINVIIDNMMSIELLFYAAQTGGNPAWYQMAVSHALQTMQNNVRADGSTYQGVEYNTTGGVISKFTSDGYSANSTWSRGQAWGLYGFTMTYRYTRDPRFLATAQQLANYFIQNLPADFVPYWDFSQTAPAPRDSSAAAIAAAGLLELSTYVPQPYQSTYYNAALSIQNSLSSSPYLGNPANTDGILLQGTYSVPANADIDTSLIWGDYYFVRGCYAAMSPPPAPTNPAARTPSPGQINLAWDAQTGAIRYSVKRSNTSGGPYVTIAPPPILTTNSFADTSAAPNTLYYYVVSAISVAGESANSVEVEASYTGQTSLLTTAVSPVGSGSIAANPSSPNGYYNNGTQVQMTATPASGCAFTGWSGALTGITNPQALTMPVAAKITANFQCTTPTPVFLTGYALSGQSLRNDFTGWVGMKLTVGGSALTVSSLGRICAANNSQTHAVKFVNAGSGSDVAGASASVNMAGCTVGNFVYSSISPVTLSAGTTYYLVAQETQGGDRWYDQGRVSATTDAAVNSAVYSYNGVWYPLGAANTSYVPPNFQYSIIVPAPISVTLQTSPAGPSFSVDGTAYTAAQVFTWTSGSSHTIASTSPQGAGVGIQNVWTGWSDGGAISHTVAPASATIYTASFTTQYLLTTSVSPASGGSIAASPTSAGGYYNGGTPVQLTATAASGCTFVNWTGSVPGNPQTVTMSTPQTVTANFQCSVPATTNFLTGFALNNPLLRKDFGNFVGMQLTIGGSPLVVSGLGRSCVAGNSQIHTVKFVLASTGVDVPGASASVNMSGCTAGQFVYSAAGPVTLAANTTYYLVSQEIYGGDQWYDQGTVSSTNAAAVKSSVYFYGGNWIPINSANTSYVPPNFQYTQ